MANDVPEIYSPTIEHILKMGDPAPIPDLAHVDSSKEIVALATPVYESISPRAFDCHKLLTGQLGMSHGGNFWAIPSQEHMPYHDACLYAVASMIDKEVRTKRRADWFLWLEDDIIVPSTLFQQLRAVADPEEKPFIACVGCDRYPQFYPAVWDQLPSGELKRWTTAPDKGVVRVGATGLVAALFHRSLFDRVPQPWFGISAGILQDTHERLKRSSDRPIDVRKGIKPDMLWSRRLNECGIPIYVHCGIEATHLGMGLPINGRTAPVLRDMRFMDRNILEAMTRGTGDNDGTSRDGDDTGRTETGKDSTVHADIRQGVSESVGGAHGTGDEPGEEILT